MGRCKITTLISVTTAFLILEVSDLQSAQISVEIFINITLAISFVSVKLTLINEKRRSNDFSSVV